MAAKARDPRILPRIIVGVIFSTVIIGTFWFLAPFPCPKEAAVAERLAYALRWLLPFPLLLLYRIERVGSVRATSGAKDPVGGKDQHLTLLPNKMLQNTLEQGLVYACATLMLSLCVPPSQLPIIPALAINFSVGRMLFYWGYQRPDNIDRGYGFAMGFMSNIAVMAFVSFRFVTDMVLGW